MARVTAGTLGVAGTEVPCWHCGRFGTVIGSDAACAGTTNGTVSGLLPTDPKTPMSARTGRVLALATLLAAFGACSSPPVESSEPVPEIADANRAWIDGILAGEVSDFEREVLADYWVSDEEYARARETVRSCMEDRGYEVILGERQMSVYPRPDSPAARGTAEDSLAAQDQALADREAGVLPNVEAVHYDLRANPEGWSWYEAMQACIERLGLDEGVGLSEDEMMARADADDAFLWKCRTDPWTVAREGELPYDVFPPPGVEP